MRKARACVGLTRYLYRGERFPGAAGRAPCSGHSCSPGEPSELAGGDMKHSDGVSDNGDNASDSLWPFEKISVGGGMKGG